jgi:hypothetical protein
MAGKRPSALAAPFQSRWRIAEMDLWDNDALDLVVPAFLEIKGQEGQMRFIAVTAWLDIRYDARAGGPSAEFSWEGVDEDDQRSGRGWVAPGTAGRLVGHFYFHMATIQASCASLGRFFNSLLGVKRCLIQLGQLCQLRPLRLG